jgi:formylglycine-generating enzyme required for sulfatase activity
VSNTHCLLALAAATALLVSCGKPVEDSESGAQPDRARGAAGATEGGPVEVVTRSGVEMVYVPGGEFMMGSNQGHPDEAPAHQVRITGFLMDKFEVRQELLVKVQLPNPSHWQDSPRKPVERVRWRDAKQYCNERSLLEGLHPCYNEKTVDWNCDHTASGYRLPTEAEWEYACRAGMDSREESGSPDKLRQHAWFAANAEQKTHVVGQKKPNRWGLHDLHGNVSEWCEDVYSPTYYRESPPSDPCGPSNPGRDVRRVIRGGSWKSSPDQCRATVRQGERTGDSDACFSTDYCGFRCVRRVTPDELGPLTTPTR